MQKTLRYEYKDLGRAFQEIGEFFEEEVPPEGTLKRFLEEVMAEERAEYLSAQPRERTECRRDWANGHYSRDLGTERGLIRGLRVPRVRGGGFRPNAIPRYRRRREAVDKVLREVFLAGVSTRRVGACVRGLVGEAVSASTVSRVCEVLSREVEAFKRRPLKDHYRYLLLDGLFFKVRAATGYRRKVLLCAYGITQSGHRELIAFRLVRVEGEASWTSFLNDIYYRGLHGRRLRLITTDGHQGLLAALEVVYPFVRRQRCWFHKMQNLSGYARKRDREALLAGARTIYLAGTRRGAIRAFWRWAHSWRETYPKAVRCIEKDLDELLFHFREPLNLRPTLRTTNPLERAFREVRRRTRPMSVFNNDESLERIALSVFNHLNSQWKRHPLKVSTQNS
ncbi:MAG: IS256 family transposase [Nitrospinota bacterium]